MGSANGATRRPWRDKRDSTGTPRRKLPRLAAEHATVSLSLTYVSCNAGQGDRWVFSPRGVALVPLMPQSSPPLGVGRAVEQAVPGSTFFPVLPL